MEKAWSVKIPIWDKNVSSKEKAEIHEFRAFQHTEEDAKVRALIDAAKMFPLDEGWAYDDDNITVQEISHDEMGKMLEPRGEEIAEQSNQRIDEALDELERKTGVRLRKPE